MSQKHYDVKPDGTPIKKAGWFSWRHQTREACDAAREEYGGRRSERQARKREEAEARDAALPIDSPRRRRNRVSPKAASCMTIRTVSSDTLQQLAFDNPGAQIHYGAHEADLTIGDTMYVARLEPVA